MPANGISRLPSCGHQSCHLQLPFAEDIEPGIRPRRHEHHGLVALPVHRHGEVGVSQADDLGQWQLGGTLLDCRQELANSPLGLFVDQCRSPALPGPVRGEDRYEIEDGKITRLEVRITDGF